MGVRGVGGGDAARNGMARLDMLSEANMAGRSGSRVDDAWS